MSSSLQFSRDFCGLDVFNLQMSTSISSSAWVFAACKCDNLRLSQQFEACHTALDIRIFQGMVVALFHSGDFVDPAVRFIHVHDKTIVPAVIDFVSGEAVAR